MSDKDQEGAAYEPKAHTMLELGSHNSGAFRSLDGYVVGSKIIVVPSDRSPRMFLNFANADLSDGESVRSRVNALSNAKRALHFQVELIAEALGFAKSPFKKRNNFPEKLDFCGKCGVVAPRILGKLNASRNALEHEYYLPSRDESENFVDVTTLFIAATDHLLEVYPRGVEIEKRRCSLPG